MLNTNCKNCGKQFTISDEDIALIEKVSPKIREVQYLFPPPTLCPECRFQLRAAYRNDRNLFERVCDMSGKKMISMYSADAPVKVIRKDLWWGDSWNPMDYGRDFDFKRPFFDQFAELDREVPHPNVIIFNDENSLYTNYNMNNKNCYLCFAGNYLEDSLYCYNGEHSRNCIDCLFVSDSELCYENIHCDNCYNTNYCRFSKNCKDSMFLEDCMDCSNCILCFNLRHKKYCILNKQYTKEEYERLKNQYVIATHEGIEKMKKIFEEESKKYPKRCNRNISTEDCTGDLIIQSRNCQECFIMNKNCEDCRHVFNGFPGLKDAIDATYCGENTSLVYESIASGDNCQTLLFDNIVFNGSSEVLYSHYCANTKNSFGCSGIRNGQYCILNKQYTKEEYEELVPKIIDHMRKTGEWGEFFPIKNSPFGYNISFAQEYAPIREEEGLAHNYRWEKKEEKEYHEATTQLPESIDETSDEITKEIFTCTGCTKNYRITPQELRFYKDKNIALPKYCADCRHITRIHQCNSPHFYNRTCAKCSASIATTYPPNSGAIVYCEKCYLKAIY